MNGQKKVEAMIADSEFDGEIQRRRGYRLASGNVH
jgi:hypothetical protein